MTKHWKTLAFSWILAVACAFVFVGCGGEATPTPEKPSQEEEAMYTRIDATGNKAVDGSYILFGNYPQSEVTDGALKESLTDVVGALPLKSGAVGWRSYEYYTGMEGSGASSNSADFMWYKDIESDGMRYRAVYFTGYRPYWTSYSSTPTNTHQVDNGYYTEMLYFFRYEPIKWRILTEESGQALLLCEMLIDSQEFYHATDNRSVSGETVYANNYEHSDIRTFLNKMFYETAFNEYQKGLIQLTTVDNSAATTSNSSNAYACRNTQDRVFLPSYRDMVNTSYGFTSEPIGDPLREKKTTDYAQCQGAYTRQSTEGLGNGSWWLRSPNFNSGELSQYVYYNGYAAEDRTVNFTYLGVCPMLRINLG